METLLQINASLFADGQSTRLTEHFVARWRAAHPRGEVIVRNLTADPVPHLSAERFAALSRADVVASARDALTTLAI